MHSQRPNNSAIEAVMLVEFRSGSGVCKSPIGRKSLNGLGMELAELLMPAQGLYIPRLQEPFARAIPLSLHLTSLNTLL